MHCILQIFISDNFIMLLTIITYLEWKHMTTAEQPNTTIFWDKMVWCDYNCLSNHRINIFFTSINKMVTQIIHQRMEITNPNQILIFSI